MHHAYQNTSVISFAHMFGESHAGMSGLTEPNAHHVFCFAKSFSTTAFAGTELDQGGPDDSHVGSESVTGTHHTSMQSTGKDIKSLGHVLTVSQSGESHAGGKEAALSAKLSHPKHATKDMSIKTLRNNLKVCVLSRLNSAWFTEYRSQH